MIGFSGDHEIIAGGKSFNLATCEATVDELAQYHVGTENIPGHS